MSATTDLIPSGASDFTPGWLSSVLSIAGYGEIAVASLDTEAVGTGQMGATFRLSVAYAKPRPDLPRTFVAKISSPDPATRERVALGYKAEVEFYQRVAQTVQVPVPACYFSAIVQEGTEFVLLLSDLAPAVQGDQLSGCTPVAALPAVTALAGFHGSRWCDPEWLTFSATAMPRADENVAKAVQRFASKATRLMVSSLGPQMTTLNRETLEQFPDLVADWLLLFPDRFSLIHGDYRLDNLMFDPSGQQVMVVDWQGVSVGLPARDLGFFVSTSLSTSDRRESEMGLLGAYHSALLGFDVRDYSLDACEQDYRIGVLQGPLTATMGWANASVTERGNAMMLAMLDRSLQTIRDLASFELVRELSARGDRR